MTPSTLGAFAGCVTGDAIYRRSSFLLDRLGQRVASELVTLVDDPLLPGGPGSRPFDGDGLPARRNVVVERGELRTWLLDTYGPDRLRQIYSTHSDRMLDRIAAAYGRTLEALEAEWLRFCETFPG